MDDLLRPPSIGVPSSSEQIEAVQLEADSAAPPQPSGTPEAVAAVDEQAASATPPQPAVRPEPEPTTFISAKVGKTRILGVDVSHHQGDAGIPQGTWKAMRAAGVRFAIIKATQGTGYEDPAFRANLDRARQAGLLVGAYHFTIRGDGAAQAEHFLRVCRQRNGGDLDGLLLSMDVERDPAGATARRADVIAFARTLSTKARRRQRVVYSNPAGLAATGSSGVDFRALGLRQWAAQWISGRHSADTPNLPAEMPNTPWGGFTGPPDLWQFGRLHVADLAIDGDAAYRGSFDKLREWWLGATPLPETGGPTPGPKPVPKDEGGGLVDDLLGDLQGLIDAPAEFVRGLVDQIVGTVRDIVARLGDAVADTLRKALAGLVSVVRDIADGVSRVIGKVVDGLVETVRGIGEQIGRVVGKVLDTLADVVKTVRDALADVGEAIARGIREALHAVGETVVDIISRIQATIGDLISRAGAVIGDVGGKVLESVGDILDEAGRGLGDILGSVQEGLDGLLRDITPAVDSLVEALRGAPGALFDLGQQLTDRIIPAIGDAAHGAGEFLADPVKGILGAFFEEEELSLLARLEPVFERIAGNPKVPRDIAGLFPRAGQQEGPIIALGAIMLLPLVVGPIFVSVIEPILQVVRQEENRVFRPTMLGLADGITAVHRGERDADWLLGVGAQLGFEDEDIRLAIETQRPLGAVGDVLQWRHRGIITDQQATRSLRDLGFDEQTTRRYIDGSAVRPGVGDLVRFAVREAFPGQSTYDATAKSTPERFIAESAKSGLSGEHARSYWAAHWELPSIGQVYEMFQRGVIDQGKLDAYLIAADVHPEWREALTKISHPPLTRVDVRRMHQLGILSDDDLVRAYMDNGYDKANAEGLAKFTIALEDEAEKGAAHPERDLTRADLMGAYADGITGREDTERALILIGYSTDEAALILDREDLRAQRAERKELKDRTVSQAVAGIIDFATAQDRLAGAGLSTDEQAITMDAIARGREARLAAPTRADLFRMHKARLITDEDLTSALVAMGYQEPWLARYVALAKTALAPISESATA